MGKRRYTRKSTLATKKYVRNLLDKKIEDKTHEIDQGFRPADTAADYVVSQIAAGTGESNRTGTEISVKSFYFRAIAERHATPAENKIRVIVWIDRSPDATLSYTDILETDTSLKVLYSPYNTDNAGAYTILYDKLFILSTNSGYARFTKLYKRWKTGHRIKYIGTGATDYGRGQIKMTYVSDDATSGVSLPYFSVLGRLTYEDA